MLQACNMYLSARIDDAQGEAVPRAAVLPSWLLVCTWAVPSAAKSIHTYRFARWVIGAAGGPDCLTLVTGHTGGMSCPTGCCCGACLSGPCMRGLSMTQYYFLQWHGVCSCMGVQLIKGG